MHSLDPTCRHFLELQAQQDLASTQQALQASEADHELIAAKHQVWANPFFTMLVWLDLRKKHWEHTQLCKRQGSRSCLALHGVYVGRCVLERPRAKECERLGLVISVPCNDHCHMQEQDNCQKGFSRRSSPCVQIPSTPAQASVVAA
eukprot:465102-Pelagomonas_calceolata.AAC.9